MSAAKALPLSCIYLTHFDDHNDGIGDGDIDDIDDGGDIDGIADGDSDDSDDGVGKKVAANSPQLWILTSPALTCSSWSRYEDDDNGDDHDHGDHDLDAVSG